MPKFSWKGVDKTGKIVGGDLDGVDKNDIVKQVKSFGCFPTQVIQLTNEIPPEDIVIREKSIWERLSKWLFGNTNR